MTMGSFDEGYSYFIKETGAQVAGLYGDKYVGDVKAEIDILLNDLNQFDGYKTDSRILKGDIAEFWHSDTFNINAVSRDSTNTTYVNRSHDLGSVDISSNFGADFGLKYYKDGAASAKQQAKSIFERYKESKPNYSIDEFIDKLGYDNDSVLHDPIYQGQIRVIPKDQLVDACEWLKQKILTESVKRPEQVKRYTETLKLLTDCLKDGDGTESISLTEGTAKELATLAKTGDVTAEKLEELGISPLKIIQFEYLMQQAFKAGLTSAVITTVMSVVPEVYKAIDYLITNGEIDEKQFRRIGFAAVTGSSLGFVRGVVSAAITIGCQAGFLGKPLMNVSPSLVGVATIIAVDTMKNAFMVAANKMTQYELVQSLIKDLIISAPVYGFGLIFQGFVGIPVLGFMLGSFLGTVIGAFAVNMCSNAILSFCSSTGFTMFGLVRQSYELPEEMLREIGISVFHYQKFNFKQFTYRDFHYRTFNFKAVHIHTINIQFLRRGVIGVSEIGYIDT